MSFLVAYEVQTFEAGTWKITSMFNEKELALIEARRIEEGIRRRETRVVEESHDEESGRTRTRIVYTTPRLRNESAPAPAQGHAPAKAPAKTAQPAAEPTRKAPPRKAAAAAGGPGYLMIAISFILIVALGAGGLVGLRYLAQLG